MTVRRLLLTALAMGAVALALDAVAPGIGTSIGVLVTAPEAATPSGAEDVVLAATALLAWLAWCWGAVGLVLTAASGLPGVCGATARLASRVLLPAGLRSAAGVALGVGLVVAGPAASAAGPADPPVTAAAPDWPRAAEHDGPPDWPAAPPDQPAQVHVVAAGDCLWRIASARLDQAGDGPTDAAVARAVTAWWRTNADVIGADPDLIHPGQRLVPPPAPSSPASSDDRPGSPR